MPQVVETAGKFWQSEGLKLARVGYYGPGLTAGQRGTISRV
jgi:hypothetical protein